MSGKKFRTGLFGYKKKDVYEFIENLAKDMEEQVKQKDGEINNLKTQCEQLKENVVEANNKYSKVENDKEFIANSIIRAEEQAKRIIDEAIEQAKREKELITTEIVVEKDKLRKVKQDLKDLKLYAVSAVKKYEHDIDNVIGEELIGRKEADYDADSEFGELEVSRGKFEEAKIDDKVEMQSEAGEEEGAEGISYGMQFEGNFVGSEDDDEEETIN